MLLAVTAAVIFGVGLVATGKAAALVPPIWVAIAARLVGLVVVVLPLVLQRRLTLTRAALPLVVIAGTGEIFGSTLSAWGAPYSIADRGRPRLAVRGDRRGRSRTSCSASGCRAPSRRRGPDRRRRHRPRGVSALTGYTPAS